VPASLEWEDLFYGRFEVPSRGEGTAASLRVLFTPTSAADQLWVHWLPTEVGRLPGEVVAPIAHTVYFPSDAEVLSVPPKLETGLPPIYERPEGGAADVLDPQISSVDAAEVLTLEAAELPSVVSAPVTASVTPVLPIFTSGARGTPRASEGETEIPHWMRSILAEATNPVPPHLRTDPGPATEPAPDPPIALGFTGPAGPSGP